MKKIIVTTSILLISWVVSAQQDVSYSKQKKIQYYHAIETDAIFGLNEMGIYPFLGNYQSWGASVRELHGIRFNPHLILSAEIGSDFYYFSDLNHKQDCPDMFRMTFMLGVNFKYIMLKKSKWSPFLMLDCMPLGIGMIGEKQPIRKWNSEEKYNRFDFSVGEIGVFLGANYNFGELQSVSMALGYVYGFSSELRLRVGIRIR